MLYYFLTIDKVDLTTQVVKQDYEVIINKWVKKGIILKGVNPVECYEENSLGRIHYHCICKAKQMIVYKKMQVKGYSIRFKYLKAKEDIFNTAGYINKHKIDKEEYKRLKNDRDDLRTTVSHEGIKVRIRVMDNNI